VLALALSDGTFLVWDLQTGVEVHHSQSTGITRDQVVALHPSEPLVASCSYSTTRVLLHDYHASQVVQTIDPPW